MRLRTAGVALGLCLALLVGCSQASKPPPAPQGSLLPASPTALPEFDVATFNTLLAQLAAKGMPVVVNIWASWCGPCTIEAPQLAKVSSAFEGRVQFLGVDIQDNLTPARAFIQKYAWTYPSVFDPPAAIRDGLGLTGQPVTVVFDQAGKQAFVWNGAIPADVLTTELNTILAA